MCLYVSFKLYVHNLYMLYTYVYVIYIYIYIYSIYVYIVSLRSPWILSRIPVISEAKKMPSPGGAFRITCGKKTAAKHCLSSLQLMIHCIPWFRKIQGLSFQVTAVHNNKNSYIYNVICIYIYNMYVKYMYAIHIYIYICAWKKYVCIYIYMYAMYIYNMWVIYIYMCM